MAIWDDWLKNRIQGQINDLIKSDESSAPDIGTPRLGDGLPDLAETNHSADAQIGRKGIIDDPYFDFASNIYHYAMSS